MGKVLLWIYFIILTLCVGYVNNRVSKLEQSMSGLTTLLVLTNDSVKQFVKDVLPSTQIKDKYTRNKVFKQQVKNHFDRDIKELDVNDI